MNLLLTILIMAKCWRIPGWWVHHENNKSRDIDTLSYHLQPNDMDGLAFGYLRAQPDGWEIYGLFGGFKMLCSKSQPIEARRGGWLYRNGTILTVEIMVGMLGATREKVVRALTVLSTPPMDWMTEEDLPPMTPDLPTARGGHAAGTPPARGGHAAGTPPARGGHSTGTKSAALNDVLTDKDPEGSKEPPAAFATAEQRSAAIAQRAQVASVRETINRLEKLGERSEKQEVKLQKNRALKLELERRQAAGNFTPVVEQTA